MGEPGRSAALAIAAFLTMAGIVGGFVGMRPGPARPDTQPAVPSLPGTLEVAATCAPPGGGRAKRRKARFQAWDERVPGGLRRGSFETLAVHPFAGPPIGREGEDGPPWHFVLDSDATMRFGVRLRERRPGGPAWMAPGTARSCFHLALPWASRMSDERRTVLGDLVAWLGRRVGLSSDSIRFAPDFPGGPDWPEGVSVGTILGEEIPR